MVTEQLADDLPRAFDPVQRDVVGEDVLTRIEHIDARDRGASGDVNPRHLESNRRQQGLRVIRSNPSSRIQRASATSPVAPSIVGESMWKPRANSRKNAPRPRLTYMSRT